MPGRGNAHTKLLTFQNAIELVMVLPGQITKETRAQFASIIQRYLAGDHTLISEIQANAVSSSPVAKIDTNWKKDQRLRARKFARVFLKNCFHRSKRSTKKCQAGVTPIQNF